ncbi:hypothetical protein SAMN02745150_01414 [Brevinema andersonii]|uniref:Uncharacterized protein n=2 Tax=Brevinema andersonii TaxID=34097 RepID=A0A1I1FCI8_BREAD|nr:hypothetical protein SAMN02745150_01414 [Brevinema andersonii]
MIQVAASAKQNHQILLAVTVLTSLNDDITQLFSTNMNSAELALTLAENFLTITNNSHAQIIFRSSLMNNQALETARILLNTKAVKLNVQHPFTFTSGIKSPIYCDNRYLLGFPEERDKIIDYFCSLTPILDTEVIVGTATAGIAWAAIIADRLKNLLLTSVQKKTTRSRENYRRS